MTLINISIKWLIFPLANVKQIHVFLALSGIEIFFQLQNLIFPLTLILLRKSRPLNVPSATIFKQRQSRLRILEKKSMCQIAWIRMRRRVTRRLIQIKVV